MNTATIVQHLGIQALLSADIACDFEGRAFVFVPEGVPIPDTVPPPPPQARQEPPDVPPVPIATLDGPSPYAPIEGSTVAFNLRMYPAVKALIDAEATRRNVAFGDVVAAAVAMWLMGSEQEQDAALDWWQREKRLSDRQTEKRVGGAVKRRLYGSGKGRRKAV